MLRKFLFLMNISGSDSNDSGYIEELYIETKYKDVGDEENVSTHIGQC